MFTAQKEGTAIDDPLPSTHPMSGVLKIVAKLEMKNRMLKNPSMEK